MQFIQILSKMFFFLAMILAGFFANKGKVLTPESSKTISSIILYIALPCSFISSLDIELTQELLNYSLTSMFLAFLSLFICLFGSKIYGKMFNLPIKQLKLHRFALVFSNTSFLGFPVVSTFFNEKVFLGAVMWNIIFMMFSPVIGIMLISDTGSEKLTKADIINILKSPMLIGIYIGSIFFLTPLTLPTDIRDNFTTVGSIVTPLSLILIGNNLAGASFKGLFSDKVLWITCFLRLLLIPIISFVIMYFVTDDYYYRVLPTIMSGLPIAAMLSIYAEAFDSDRRLSSLLVFLSTLLSLLTIPVIVYMLELYA